MHLHRTQLGQKKKITMPEWTSKVQVKTVPKCADPQYMLPQNEYFFAHNQLQKPNIKDLYPFSIFNVIQQVLVPRTTWS